MPEEKDDSFPLLTYLDDLVEDLRGLVPRAVKEQDKSAVHHARVSTRRLKAALELMAPAVSGKCRKPFDAVTKKLRRQLGPLRDLDVMIDRLGETKLPRHEKAISWIKTRLTERRTAAAAKAQENIPPARVLARLGSWWGLRQEIAESKEKATGRLAESVHLQLDAFAEQAELLVKSLAGRAKQVIPAIDAPAAHAIAGAAADAAAPAVLEPSVVDPSAVESSVAGPAAGAESVTALAPAATAPGGTASAAAPPAGPAVVAVALTATSEARNDPHDLRIAGKSLRYTLEMAGKHGQPLPGGVLDLFKRLQESLGAWHDMVVLTEHIMGESVNSDLALHDPSLQGELLGLAQLTLRKAQVELKKVADLWKSRGEELSRKIRKAFPLTAGAAEAIEASSGILDAVPVGSVDLPEQADASPVAAIAASDAAAEAPAEKSEPVEAASGTASAA